MVNIKNLFRSPFKRKTEVIKLDEEKHYLRIGTSGTQVFSGYFDEEYLRRLQGYQGAELYDEMRRSDGQIRMLLSVVKNPILSADWSIDSVDDSEQEVFIKEFIEHVLFNDIRSDDNMKYKTWTDFLEEALTCLEFGYSLFEIVHKVVTNHPKFGNYIGLKDLAFRNPKTIEEWHLERDGAIKSVRQVVNGDLEVDTFIEGKFLMPITINKEGDNYEGISTLRFIYGNWLRKNLYRKLQGIGVEKSALGTPIGKIPSGRENSDEADQFEEVLERYTSHESGYIMLSEGWEVDELKPTFDSEKVQKTIDGENIEMTKSFLANFMELGLSGSGSFALGSDLSDIFLSGIELYGDKIAQAINHKVIPTIVDAKFGKRDFYPKLKVTGINDKAGKEYADIIKLLVESQIIDPTDTRIKSFAHKRFGLPDFIESREVENENEDNRLDNTNNNDRATQLHERAKFDEEEEVRASEVQSLIFKKENFERQQAIDWSLKHGFKAEKIDDTDNSYRIRQKDPSLFKRFTTKEITTGVMAVIGFEDDEDDGEPEPVVLDETFRPPKGAQNNAKKVLKWRAEHGNEVKGMTAVGWRRANQLAKGQPLSIETVKRIAQFARHKSNSKIDPKFKGEPWKDRGYVAWLGWGGDEAILSWAPKVIKSFETKKKLGEVILSEKRSESKRKVKNFLNERSKAMTEIMSKHLTDNTNLWLQDIKKILEKENKSEARRRVLKTKIPNMRKYKKELEEFIIDLCYDATRQAIRESPLKSEDIKLDEFDRKFKTLPKQTRDNLKTELSLLVGTQENDLEKAVFFTFNSSIDSQEDAQAIINDLQDSVVTITQGSRVTTAGVNSVSNLTNMSRLQIFQTEEVWNEIESYEFYNVDPKSAICQNLAGRIFKKDDAMAKSFLPPLHHNCKSILIPQWVGDKNKPIDPIGLQPTGSKAEVERIMKSKGF